MVRAGEENVTYITQALIDASSSWMSDAFPLNETIEYEISGNLVIPAHRYFANQGCVSFNGNDYSVTIVPAPTETVSYFGGLFDSNGIASFSVGNVHVKSAQDVILDASSGWLFRFGTTCAQAKSCSSTGAISEVGSGGIFGANIDNLSETPYAKRCFSTGIISGNYAGGIFGNNSTGARAITCYSRGNITGSGAGGIIGGISSMSQVANSYSLGRVSAGAGGIWGAFDSDVIFGYESPAPDSNTATLDPGYTLDPNGGALVAPRLPAELSYVYVAGASQSTGAFFAGSDASGSPSRWSDGWSSTIAATVLDVFPEENITTGVFYSWAENTPYQLIPLPGPTPTPVELTTFVSQVTVSTPLTIAPSSLNLQPPLTDNTPRQVLFMPNDGVANVSDGTAVYLIGTAGTTSTVTLNGVSVTVGFNADCTFTIGGGTYSVGQSVTVGTLVITIVGCGSAYITVLQYLQDLNAGGPSQLYLNNTERIETARGNCLVSNKLTEPTLKFKTYADYITYIKSVKRGCC